MVEWYSVVAVVAVLVCMPDVCREMFLSGWVACGVAYGQLQLVTNVCVDPVPRLMPSRRMMETVLVMFGAALTVVELA